MLIAERAARMGVPAREGGVFRDVDHALRWAARISQHPLLQPPAAYDRMRRPGDLERPVGALTGFERHGEAAIIVTLVVRHLDPAGVAYVAARYWRQLDQAVPLLTTYAQAALPSGVWGRRGVDQLVRNAFLPTWRAWMKLIPRPQRDGLCRTPLAKIRRDLRVDMRVMPEYQRLVTQHLFGLRSLVLAQLEGPMTDAGLLETR